METKFTLKYTKKNSRDNKTSTNNTIPINEEYIKIQYYIKEVISQMYQRELLSHINQREASPPDQRENYSPSILQNPPAIKMETSPYYPTCKYQPPK